MRRLLAAALPAFLLASAVAAEEAAPAAPVAPAPAPKEPAASISGSMGYVAEVKTLESVEDLEAFVGEFTKTRFDTKRAAKLENFVLKKDGGEWTLNGYLFARGGARGVQTRGIFFGEGTFKSTPPIDMERQQVRRFLGKDSIDVPVKQVTFTFYDAEDQQVLTAFPFDEATATEAFEKNEAAKTWAEGVEKYWSRPQDPEEIARREYGEIGMAATAYERFLDPKFDGDFSAEMEVKVPETADTTSSHLVGLAYYYRPDELKEITIAGQFDHGEKKYWSRISEFDLPSQYDPSTARTGSSPYLEKERKDELLFAYNRLRMTFDPTGKRDIKMRSEMDLVVATENLTAIGLGITPYMGCTKAWFEGKEVAFFQPAIPGRDWYHAPFIVVTLPRKVKKGETLKVALELEGKILYRADAATWMVKEEDNWFPTPGNDLGGLSTYFETTLNVPPGYTGIANGREAPCPPEDVVPGMECFYYKTNTGIDFATFNIGKNMRIVKGMSLDEDADLDGVIDPKVPITIYTNGEAKREFEFVNPDNPSLVEKRSYSLSENAEDALGRAQIAHKVYSEWFGPCPYDTLMITPHPKGHGRGSASLLLIAQEAFLSGTAFAEFASLNRRPNDPWAMTQFLVHEIAHQWWGGAARIGGTLDQWMSEGFSDYASAIVLEEYDKINDTKWFWGQMQIFRDHLLRDDGYINTVTPLAMGNRVMSSENRDGYEGYRQNFMYSKGAYVMHMLRTLARAKMGDPVKGDDLFKQGWRDFMKLAETKAPSNMDLEASLTKSYGMPMNWFFDQWIYGTGVPKVDWSYTSQQKPDGWYVTCRVAQKDTSFQFPVAVSFYQGKQEAGFAHQWVGKKETDLVMGPLPFKPDKIALNEDLGVLAIFKEVPWSATATAAGQ